MRSGQTRNEVEVGSVRQDSSRLAAKPKKESKEGVHRRIEIQFPFSLFPLPSSPSRFPADSLFRDYSFGVHSMSLVQLRMWHQLIIGMNVNLSCQSQPVSGLLGLQFLTHSSPKSIAQMAPSSQHIENWRWKNPTAFRTGPRCWVHTPYVVERRSRVQGELIVTVLHQTYK